MPMRTNRNFAPLLADKRVRELFGTEATLSGMLRFERELTRALGDTGAAGQEAVGAALAAMDTFQPDLAAIESAVERDGLPVPEWARQLKQHAGESALPAIHVGATSQDLLDTCLALALQQANELLAEELVGVIRALDTLSDTFGERSLMGRTRMQAALPVTVASRIDLWAEPLRRQLEELSALRRRVELLQFAGPVGLRDKPEGLAGEVAGRMAELLGLQPSVMSWHATRDNLVAYGQFLARVSGALGKMGQDIAIMALQGIDEVRLSGGGVSSAMPHKQNPVLAETLVAFARYNATQSGGLAQALVHEQERSGAAWTLEWMILPPMLETTMKGLSLAARMLGQVESVGKPAG